MPTLAEYLRRAADRHPDAALPRHRRLEEMARDGARWVQKTPNGRWEVVDEIAADTALGLTSNMSTAV